MFGQSKLTDDIRPVKLRFWQENGLGYNAMGAVQVLYQNALGETRWTNQYGAGPSNKPTCEINVPYDDPIVQVTIRSGNWIDFFSIRSAKKDLGSCGNASGGAPQSYVFNCNDRFFGWWGYAGDRLNYVGPVKAVVSN